MSVPNHKDVIEAVLARFADQLVQPAAEVDGIGRRLLPHFIDAMPADERPNWGVLRKSTGTFPYDILVWKPTREHFDVLTSRAISGDEEHDKTGPRRLIGTWNTAGVLPRPDWTWSDWHDSGIVPLDASGPEPPPPPPPPPPDDTLADRVDALTVRVAGVDQTVRAVAEAQNRYETALADLQARMFALEHAPAGPLPELVAEGDTEERFYHKHHVVLAVRRK